MLLRLQKYLADSGISSRRKAEELIIDGKISVNGKIITELGTKVDDENDIIMYEGKRVEKEKRLVYIMLHKPEGYITSAKDQFDRPTVIDLIEDIEERVYPVGRLDYDTSGLLLLTNDGDLTFKLTHPKHDIEKVYIAKVIGTPTDMELESFRIGLYIDDYKTSKAKISIVKTEEKYTTLKIAIKEGKNRQVRRMCEEINHPAVALKRIATGRLFLGDLIKGHYRNLKQDEIDYLKEL